MAHHSQPYPMVMLLICTGPCLITFKAPMGYAMTYKVTRLKLEAVKFSEKNLKWFSMSPPWKRDLFLQDVFEIFLAVTDFVCNLFV